MQGHGKHGDVCSIERLMQHPRMRREMDAGDLAETERAVRIRRARDQG